MPRFFFLAASRSAISLFLICLAALLSTAFAGENLRGSVSITRNENVRGQRKQTTDMERLAVRFQERLDQQRQISLYGEGTRQTDSALKHPSIRPRFGGTYTGPWYTLSHNYRKVENRNHQNATATLSDRHRDWSLNLRPEKLPQVNTNYSRSESFDNLKPRQTDNMTENLSIQARQRFKFIDMLYSRTENEFTNWATGFDSFEISPSSRYIAATRSGSTYVTERGEDQVLLFAAGGGLATSWGGSGAGPGKFNGPTGITLDSAGNVYVVDSGNNRVQKFDPSGEYLLDWGRSGSANGQFLSPEGIAFGDNALYVVDTGNSRVQKFDTQGNFIDEWGTSGNGLGEFSFPRGIAASNLYVYVADTGNNRIQRFDPDGTAPRAWGNTGTAEGEFDTPSDVAVDAARFVYVVDSGNNRVQKFNRDGGFVNKWGRSGTNPNQFSGPWGAATDQDHLYVVDQGNQRIKKYTHGGVFVDEQGLVTERREPFVRRSTTETLNTSFSVRPWGPLRVSGNLQQTDTTSEVLSGDGADNSSEQTIGSLSSSIQIVSNVFLSHNWTKDTRLSFNAGSETERWTESNSFGLSSRPYYRVQNSLSVNVTEQMATNGQIFRTESSSYAISGQPRRNILLDANYYASENFQDGIPQTLSTGVTFNANLNVRHGIDLRFSSNLNGTETFEGDALSTSTGSRLDAFLQVTPRLSAILHYEVTLSTFESDETPRTEQETIDSGLAFQWRLSDEFSIYSDYTKSETGEFFTTSRNLGANWRFGRHVLRATWDSTLTNDLATDSIQYSMSLALGHGASVSTSYEQVIRGLDKDDWRMFTSFSKSF